MVKQFTFGVLSAAILAGCGGSSGGSSNANSIGTSYSISDYTAIESTSLEGTWVYVANGTEKDTADTYFEEGSFSVKNFYIVENRGGLSMSNCSSGYRSLELSGNSVVLPISDQAFTIENNNQIKGTVNNVDANGDYKRFSFDLVKVSNTTSLGTISTTWSGTAVSGNNQLRLQAVCAESVSKTDSDGDQSVYSTYQFGTESYSHNTEARKGHIWGESMERLYASGGQDTLFENSMWGGDVDISYTESETSFTGHFNATSSAGQSVNVVVNALLP